MPSSIWSGSISLGLVSVPVKLYSAVRAKTVRFHQLSAKDHARIEQKRVSSASGEEVAYADIVKGYEVAPGKYVVIDSEELATLSPEETRTIDIEDFVDLADIDPIFYDNAYYLAPANEAAVKPYLLLLDAMCECGKVAVGRVVLRSKEHLVAIRTVGRVLAMASMNFADEILPAEQLPGMPEQEPEVSERELDMAKQLVESLASKFDPSKYHDSYREAVLALIQRKAQGEEITAQPTPVERPTAPDLMSALQASLEEIKRRTGPKTKPKPKRVTPAPKGASGVAPKRKAASRAKAKTG